MRLCSTRPALSTSSSACAYQHGPAWDNPGCSRHDNIGFDHAQGKSAHVFGNWVRRADQLNSTACQIAGAQAQCRTFDAIKAAMVGHGNRGATRPHQRAYRERRPTPAGSKNHATRPASACIYHSVDRRRPAAQIRVYWIVCHQCLSVVNGAPGTWCQSDPRGVRVQHPAADWTARAAPRHATLAAYLLR